VVHTDAIIGTRAQKLVSHTVAHYRIGFPHDQHGLELNTLPTPQLLVIHKRTKMVSHKVTHYRIGVCTWPTRFLVCYICFHTAIDALPCLLYHSFPSVCIWWLCTSC